MASVSWQSVFVLFLVAFTNPTAASHTFETRIVGGVEVLDRCIAPFNWMVGLRIENGDGDPVTFCSAVMLDNMTLVTAARCIYQFVSDNSSPGQAIIGERDLLAQDLDEQIIPIAGLRVYPQYNSNTYDNNIGLVRLSDPARFTQCVQPYQKMEDDPNACVDMDTTCLMAGWGPYAETNQLTNSRVVRSAPITVYDDFVSLQLELIRTQRAQPQGAVYAEAQNAFQKACFFDWGGVVSCQRNGQYVLRGVVGELNCNSNPTPPIMITDVSVYEQWLEACQRDWDSITCTGQI